jgi:hypothetical protein
MQNLPNSLKHTFSSDTYDCLYDYNRHCMCFQNLFQNHGRQRGYNSNYMLSPCAHLKLLTIALLQGNDNR